MVYLCIYIYVYTIICICIFWHVHTLKFWSSCDFSPTCKTMVPWRHLTHPNQADFLIHPKMPWFDGKKTVDSKLLVLLQTNLQTHFWVFKKKSKNLSRKQTFRSNCEIASKAAKSSLFQNNKTSSLHDFPSLLSSVSVDSWTKPQAVERKETIRIRKSGWWFQPIWKILVKMGIFPK